MLRRHHDVIKKSIFKTHRRQRPMDLKFGGYVEYQILIKLYKLHHDDVITYLFMNF